MDDATLLRQFETLALPREQWTHRAHVKVAYLYLVAHPLETALRKMREGIKAYNAHNGIPDGPATGYHETMTCAFMHIIDATLGEYGPASGADAFFDEHPQLHRRQILRLFYSRERFMSPEAKTSFVAPDLAPLPVSRRDR